MDWDDLRYVLAISRAHSLSEAAASLGVTRTTVGRRIRTFEERLGVRLFDRTPDGFTPTAAGQDITHVAERMEVDVLSLESRVFGNDAQLSGTLRVSTVDFLFAAYYDAFATFSELHPSVELTINANTEEVSLTRREADVALRISNSPPEHLIGRKLARLQFAVYGSKALVERIGADADYADYPWLSWDRARPGLDGWIRQRAPGARVALRTDGNSMVIKRAIIGGIGVHPFSVFEAAAEPNMARIGPIIPEFSRDLWLLTLADLRDNVRVRAFMDHMEVAIRAAHAKHTQEQSGH
ncbi:MAG: LysR family transcriptional regulator [Nannocystaceae bacterium]|nr:LysR family transcriptional regulator [Nannocystaceae bacterium]